MHENEVVYNGIHPSHLLVCRNKDGTVCAKLTSFSAAIYQGIDHVVPR